MALYTIADLHLSTGPGTNKSMEVFGRRWTGYLEKITENWNAIVSPEDTVVLPGDLSWALTPEEATDDLKFLDSLPGSKIIAKGNHDLWWATARKLTVLFEKNGIATVRLLYNSAFLAEGRLIAGTRGWFNDNSLNIPKGTDYQKLVNRENGRLRASLEKARALSPDAPIIAFFHFPPARGDFVCRPLVDTLHDFGVSEVYYGHIHGDYLTPRTATFEGIRMTLIAADALNFIPYRILP